MPKRIHLSKRQGQIARLMLDGMTDKEMASALNLSVHTVGHHVRVLFKKLKVRKRTQAAMKCLNMRLPNARPSFIYFLFCEKINRVKIGVSDSPEIRIVRHYTSCPFPLELLRVISGPRSLERSIHKRFEHIRRHLEWFEASPELLKYIRDLPSVKN